MISIMQVFENQTFRDFDDRNSAATFSDIEFRRCHFDGCCISMTHNPQLRSTVRNVQLLNCAISGGSTGKAVVEDVLIENLKTPGLFQTFGTVFKHVVLRGKFDRLMISDDVLPRGDVNPPYQYENVETYREANAEYYRNVDWALDISNGEFKELYIRGLPGRLIRRDPETQVLVTRQKALEGRWRELEFRDGLCAISLDLFLQREEPDLVLIAPKRHRKFPLYLEDLQLLRDAGVAEPD
jgi:hypothetical protein